MLLLALGKRRYRKRGKERTAARYEKTGRIEGGYLIEACGKGGESPIKKLTTRYEEIKNRGSLPHSRDSSILGRERLGKTMTETEGGIDWQGDSSHIRENSLQVIS